VFALCLSYACALIAIAVFADNYFQTDVSAFEYGDENYCTFTVIGFDLNDLKRSKTI